MHVLVMASFRDELVKIAAFDPELAQLQASHAPGVPGRWNDETTKQFLMDTALIAAGTGLGYGAGKLTLHALQGANLPPAVRTALQMGAPLAGGIGAVALRNMMRAEQQKRMAEAENRVPVRVAAE